MAKCNISCKAPTATNPMKLAAMHKRVYLELCYGKPRGPRSYYAM